MDYKHAAFDRIVQEFSILEKIEALHSGSADLIANASAEIGAQRRKAERQALDNAIKPSLMKTFKRILQKGLIFDLYPRTVYNIPRVNTTPDDEALKGIERDWTVTGDDLCTAINDYIKKHDLADKLSLTDTERASLNYMGPRKPPPSEPHP